MAYYPSVPTPYYGPYAYPQAYPQVQTMAGVPTAGMASMGVPMASMAPMAGVPMVQPQQYYYPAAYPQYQRYAGYPGYDPYMGTPVAYGEPPLPLPPRLTTPLTQNPASRRKRPPRHTTSPTWAQLSMSLRSARISLQSLPFPTSMCHSSGGYGSDPWWSHDRNPDQWYSNDRYGVYRPVRRFRDLLVRILS